MPAGRTGIEIIKGWMKVKKEELPVEKQFHNPLDAKIGSHVRLTNIMTAINGVEDVDLSNELLTVTEIWSWKRIINGVNHSFADYIVESGDKRLVVRVVSTASRGKADTPEILLLTHYWPDNIQGPQPWGDESPLVLDAMMDSTGEFVRFQGEEKEERYFRDLSNIPCDVSIIRDANRDGKVTIDEVATSPFSIWTFRRDTKDSVGTDVTQHLHCQLSGSYDSRTKRVNGGDKDILMLRGESIPPANFVLY